jgi:ribokinase
MRPRVSVLGSLNTDISVAVPHLPGPGETVLATSAAVIGAGGKGANQAVAAARLGARVRMVGCCGADEFGAGLLAALTAEGIDVTGVRTVGETASGLALITVDAAGENAIAVAPGANAHAGEPEVAAVLAAPCDVLVLSAEIPVPTLAAALAAVRGQPVVTVLNLAPVPDGAGAIAAGARWLVVNAQEAGALAGGRVGSAQAAQAAAAGLAEGGDAGRHVVVTLGAGGAVLAGPGGPALVPGFAVRPVDSVGAGDAFVGALAVALASGAAPAAAVRAACAAGAAATTRRGAQAGLPRPADVLAATGLRWPPPG